MDQAPTIDPVSLRSFGTGLNVAVIGASGGIGGAFAEHLQQSPDVSQVFRLSRSGTASEDDGTQTLNIDLEDEASIAKAADTIRSRAEALSLVIVATGLLHDGDRLQPEKTWRSLRADVMARAFRVNTIGPALVAKHFLPCLTKDRKAAFAVLSARVGSIADNRLGGWHAYRASKAALNMIIKTLSVELEQRNPSALCVALHPGTVDTQLSRPFQAGVPRGRLFSPGDAAGALLTVLDGLGPEDSGGFFAWDGSAIPF